MTDDPRGGWASCGDCGRIVHVSRYGTYDKHAIDWAEKSGDCPASGRLASDLSQGMRTPRRPRGSQTGRSPKGTS